MPHCKTCGRRTTSIFNFSVTRWAWQCDDCYKEERWERLKQTRDRARRDIEASRLKTTPNALAEEEQALRAIEQLVVEMFPGRTVLAYFAIEWVYLWQKALSSPNVRLILGGSLAGALGVVTLENLWSSAFSTPHSAVLVLFGSKEIGVIRASGDIETFPVSSAVIGLRDSESIQVMGGMGKMEGTLGLCFLNAYRNRLNAVSFFDIMAMMAWGKAEPADLERHIIPPLDGPSPVATTGSVVDSATASQPETGKGSVMGIVRCRMCRTRVLPMSDGNCPRCGKKASD
ncbi:MAG TPA: hypothetical protein PLR91_08515 [Kiritimatiellia bacterium]|nr:hypothetical protein [Kiritimatiellia bacterium]